MVNFLKPAITNCLGAGVTSIAFTTVLISPPPVCAVGVNLDLGSINFGIEFAKIDEKVKKCVDKGEINKIVGYKNGVRLDNSTV